MHRTRLLIIDGIINLTLGLLLVVFPDSLVVLLGVPSASHGFYPNILGGVLFGIGLALIMEVNNKTARGIGLGLGGAIVINQCGGLVLCCWLVFGNLSLPTRGWVFLWFLVMLLLAISAIELASGFRDNHSDA